VRGVAGVVLACAAALMLSCGGDGGGAGGDAVVEVPSWDGFLESAPWREGQRHPVVCIGIDGGNWHFIERLVGEGRLPGFERIMREGSYGTLQSVDNYVTPPAWTTIFSGYLPGKHGIYTFGSFDSASGEFLSDSSDDILVPMVWDAASRAGLRCGVVNVPVTFPPHPVDGIMVSGMMTPIEAESGAPMRAVQVAPSYFRDAPGIPPGSALFRMAATDGWCLYLWTMYDTIDDGAVAFDRVAMRVMSMDATGAPQQELDFDVLPLGAFSRWMHGRRERDGNLVPVRLKLKIDVDGGEVNLTTSQSVYPMEAVFTYPEELRAELDTYFGFYLPSKFFTKGVVESLTDDAVAHADFLYNRDDWDLYCFVFSETDHAHHQAGFGAEPAGVYERIDAFLQRLMERMPRDATLVIASDHGFGRFDYAVDLNVMLEQMGLLAWEAYGRLDNERTLVFHNLAYLYYNRDRITREELAERGFEVPDGADPFEFLRETVHAAAAALVGPEGRPMPVEIRPVPDGGAGRPPDDLVEVSYDGYVVEFWNLTQPSSQVVERLEGGNQMWHERDGIYLFWGSRVRAGGDTGRAHAADIAPTVLYLLGLPTAPDMDGRVLFDVLGDDARAAPAVVNRGYRDIPRERILPEDQRESLREKLRSLGYIQ
jgi:predicted AlkP superfamily phosphohydrolase/phosphomutase